MIEKQTVYLDRNEYNYGPAPEVEKVLRNFDPDKLFTTKAKRVFYPITSPNYIISRKNKSFWDMVEKIF